MNCERNKCNDGHSDRPGSLPYVVPLPLEIRVHGRGGQGGVTCAKLCALMYANLGLFVQTFGDYGMERSGAPVRAYTRVDRAPIRNRNKVYAPGHLLVLDPSLLDQGTLDGLAPGGLILINTSEDLSAFDGLYGQFRLATVNATEIARKHGIGTAAVVIVNTAMAGAYARLVDLPAAAVESTYCALGLQNDLPAAREAYQSVATRETDTPYQAHADGPAVRSRTVADVVALTEHTADIPATLKTGAWRSQLPHYRTMQAPCNAACPAGNDVVGFVQALNNDGPEAAARVLFATQPLPSVCGRVCPAPCMASCNRSGLDGAVNIRGLERLLGDLVSSHIADVGTGPNPRMTAIVGGGPAGLAAAFVFAQAGHNVTIYEGLSKLGGVLRSAIPVYRLPEDALDRDIGRILSLGVRVRCGEALDAPRILELASEYDAVVIATGQRGLVALDCPFTKLPGVEQGLMFLNRVKARGPEELQGTVIVIGGGNTALDCARTAVRCGAERVCVAYRRGREEMPAIDDEVREAIEEGVDLLLHRQPVFFAGTERVTGIDLAEVELGEPDPGGRRRPLTTDRVIAVACDHVLLAVGQQSDHSILPPEWTFKSGRAYQSDRPINVWLAGDLTTGEGTVAHAVGHGRRTAAMILAAMEGLTNAEAAPPMSVVTPQEIRFSRFLLMEPCRNPHVPAAARTSGFQEVISGLEDGTEAQRCFSCGQCTRCDTCLMYCPEGIVSPGIDGYTINEQYCKGCGICVRECPRHAMHMTAQGQ